MGYTTTFTGRFRTDKKIPLSIYDALVENAETRSHAGCPSYWCQWVPSSDAMGIEWDGNEKFYKYVDWLEFIINKFLAPENIKLNGRVLYRGEDDADVGYITVKDNVVTQEPLKFEVTT